MKDSGLRVGLMEKERRPYPMVLIMKVNIVMESSTGKVNS